MLHSDHNFTGPVRIKLSLLYLLSVGLSRLLFWFRTWVSTRCSGKTLLRDITGEPCWNLGGYLMLVLRWDGSVVTLLVLRRYGVYTVFDSRVRYLSQPVLRRESTGPSFRRWRASFESRKSYKRGSRDVQESGRAHWRVVLTSPI